MPVVLAAAFFGGDHTVFREGIFFSKAAVVTFGGAYAVLPYVAQRAVEHFHWLKPGQMMDGLGLAETTPGPLIMVLQFVGFMGGWNQPGNLPPLLAATLGALITTWVTFTPCFLWVFLGGPHIEQLRDNRKIAMTLSAVTAAVVGVILNLAVWFALHVIHPDRSFDWFAVVLGLAALIAMIRWKLGVIPVVLAGGAIGLIYSLLAGQ
jgi:chromate transporter